MLHSLKLYSLICLKFNLSWSCNQPAPKALVKSEKQTHVLRSVYPLCHPINFSVPKYQIFASYEMLNLWIHQNLLFWLDGIKIQPDTTCRVGCNLPGKQISARYNSVFTNHWIRILQLPKDSGFARKITSAKFHW